MFLLQRNAICSVIYVYNSVAHARDVPIRVDVASETRVRVVADYMNGAVLAAPVEPRFSYEERGGVDAAIYTVNTSTFLSLQKNICS